MSVEAWLAGLGLEQYAVAFAENGVDLNLLPELTNEDLKDLGVGRLGDRKTILRAIYGRGNFTPRLFRINPKKINGVENKQRNYRTETPR